MTRQYDNIMFDCETLSTKPNALIVQVAAVPFDPWAPPLDPCIGSSVFAAHLDWNKCELERNLCHVDLATVYWWMSQSQPARDRLFTGSAAGLNAMCAADQLMHFIHTHGTADVKVWSYGATADLVWLRHLLRIAGYPEPWSYRNERCLRTVAAVLPPVKRPEPAVAHDALSDALAQAEWLRDTLMHRPAVQNYALGLGGDS